MKIDTGGSQGAARLLYPDLPDLLTPADLRRLFRPTYAECQSAPTAARTPLSQVALVVQLKTFQVVGRFLRIEEIPAVIVESVAAWLRIEGEIRLVSSARTLQRQRTAILEHLGVSAWAAQTQELARATMIRIAEARTGPAELINAAVDVLVRGRCELPSLDTLRRLAATVHRQVNARRRTIRSRGEVACLYAGNRIVSLPVIASVLTRYGRKCANLPMGPYRENWDSLDWIHHDERQHALSR